MKVYHVMVTKEVVVAVSDECLKRARVRFGLPKVLDRVARLAVEYVGSDSQPQGFDVMDEDDMTAVVCEVPGVKVKL